jgi:peptide/nickel transport system substrate-binding protein
MLSRRALMFTATATPFFSFAGDGWAATPKDTVVVGKAIDDIISLDPAEAFEFSGGEVVGNCYERLVVPSPANQSDIIGELAQKWDVSADGLVITFTMRQGLKFASGAPITAEDAAFSIQRTVKLNKSPAFILNQFGANKDNVEQMVHATGPNTLVFTIKDKFAPTFVLYCLSANCGSVVEKAVVMKNAVNGDYGNAWMKTNSAGSGPFAVRSWKASESVIMDANPHSPLKTKPKRVFYKHIADPSAQQLQLQQGDLDIARDLLPDQLKAAQSNPAFKLSSAPSSYIMYLALNQKDPNLSKPQVRQAIKWAIDYDGIQKNIVPTTYDVQQNFVPKGMLGAISDRPFRKDVAKAKALLAEAGLPNGFEITIDHANTQPTSDIVQAIQANLAEIGIKASLQAAEARQVLTRYRARQHQAVLQSWGIDYFDPNTNAETFCVNIDNADDARNKTLAWRNSWKDDDMTRRTQDAVKESDAKVREKMYADLQRDHHVRSPFALLLQATNWAVMRKEVAGFSLAPLGLRTRFDHVVKS